MTANCSLCNRWDSQEYSFLQHVLGKFADSLHMGKFASLTSPFLWSSLQPLSLILWPAFPPTLWLAPLPNPVTMQPLPPPWFCDHVAPPPDLSAVLEEWLARNWQLIFLATRITKVRSIFTAQTRGRNPPKTIVLQTFGEEMGLGLCNDKSLFWKVK